MKRAIEQSLWLRRPAGQEHLWQRFGWPGVQGCGWVARRREVLSSGKVEEKVHGWIAGAYLVWALTAQQAAAYLRRHWDIENGVFYVRDGSMGEDRLHGGKIGYGLSSIRNAALNLLRTLGAPDIPDAHRRLAARPDMGLSLLI